MIAAPATGGLSIPISVAGKGLFFTGLAALTPSGILLNRTKHSAIRSRQHSVYPHLTIVVALCVLSLLGHPTGQSQQLTGLTKLVENLKSRLEIMNQKREEIAIAYAAGESVEINIKQAGNFIQDAIELEIPTFVGVSTAVIVRVLRPPHTS